MGSFNQTNSYLWISKLTGKVILEREIERKLEGKIFLLRSFLNEKITHINIKRLSLVVTIIISFRLDFVDIEELIDFEGSNDG